MDEKKGEMRKIRKCFLNLGIITEKARKVCGSNSITNRKKKLLLFFFRNNISFISQ